MEIKGASNNNIPIEGKRFVDVHNHACKMTYISLAWSWNQDNI